MQSPAFRWGTGPGGRGVSCAESESCVPHASPENLWHRVATHATFCYVLQLRGIQIFKEPERKANESLTLHHLKDQQLRLQGSEVVAPGGILRLPETHKGQDTEGRGEIPGPW